MKAHSTMGNWRIRKDKKRNNGAKNSTPTKKARIYLAIPPEGGWPGGRPEENGFKFSGK